MVFRVYRAAHGWTDRLASQARMAFERQPGLVNGLVYEKKIGPDYSKISADNVDIFYDVNRSTTYIVCGTGTIAGRGEYL